MVYFSIIIPTFNRETIINISSVSFAVPCKYICIFAVGAMLIYLYSAQSTAAFHHYIFVQLLLERKSYFKNFQTHIFCRKLHGSIFKKSTVLAQPLKGRKAAISVYEKINFLIYP